MLLRSPLARTRPSATASAHGSRPAASRTQVIGSSSTTLDGVPLVWRGPSTHCTAAIGGTRTSTACPGALATRAASNVRVAIRRAPASGSPAGDRSRPCTTPSTHRVARKSSNLIPPNRVGITRAGSVDKATSRNESAAVRTNPRNSAGAFPAANERVPSSTADAAALKLSRYGPTLTSARSGAGSASHRAAKPAHIERCATKSLTRHPGKGLASSKTESGNVATAWTIDCHCAIHASAAVGPRSLRRTPKRYARACERRINACGYSRSRER
jgi:hypothetical protein